MITTTATSKKNFIPIAFDCIVKEDLDKLIFKILSDATAAIEKLICIIV